MSHRIPVDTNIWHFRVSSSDDNNKIIQAWKNIDDLKSLWFGKSITTDEFIGFIEFEKEEDYEVVESMFFFIEGNKQFKPFYISDSLYEYMCRRNEYMHNRNKNETNINMVRKECLSDMAMADI